MTALGVVQRQEASTGGGTSHGAHHTGRVKPGNEENRKDEKERLWSDVLEQDTLAQVIAVKQFPETTTLYVTLHM